MADRRGVILLSSGGGGGGWGLYLLHDEAGHLVVEDGPQAVDVGGGVGIQAEVQCNVDGGQLVPELLVVLHTGHTTTPDTFKSMKPRILRKSDYEVD